MKKISDTINRAISLKGIEILKSSHRFYDVLEDLSPQLVEDLSFIRRAYSDQLGELVYAAVIAGKSTKDSRVSEIFNYLKNEEGRDEKWTNRLLKCFHESIYNTDFSAKEPTKTIPSKISKNTKPFVAKSTIYVYKAPGRFIFFISLVVQAICLFLINIISYYNGDGIFSFISGGWRDVLGGVAVFIFALSTIMGKDGLSVFNVVPAFVEIILFFASERNAGMILLMFYCLIAHIAIDFNEEEEKHHKLLFLDIVVLMEIAIGLIVGHYFNTYIPTISIVLKATWILYILEFCSIVMITGYLLNTRRRQIELRNNYALKVTSKYEVSEVDPENLFFFLFGNVIFLISGIIILVIRIFKKEAFNLLVEIGLVRVSILTTIFLIIVVCIWNSTKYIHKDKKWTTE